MQIGQFFEKWKDEKVKRQKTQTSFKGDKVKRYKRHKKDGKIKDVETVMKG